ncbi:MAG: hypothetical protein PHR83_07815 [Paludibacter sp.]|nr:hypothetical protein [Paludibacter sp.]
MEGKCSNPDCPAPISCHDGHDNHTECPNWVKNNTLKTKVPKELSRNSSKSSQVWSGDVLKIDDVSQISYRNTPIIIGLAGKAKAGKTTFLSMLYTLLLNGQEFSNYGFAGTKTIIGWDNLYNKLKVKENKVSLPEPTPTNYLRLLHFALRNNEDQLKDVLLTDASGEVFTNWSQNKDAANAKNAQWIYDRSNGFILFIDCDDLITRKNSAKTEIIDIAEMLNNDLKERPVIAVWSKADLKADVHPKIKESLQKELQEIFSNYTEIDISNFPSKNPDEIVHKNNLKVIDWLLASIILPSKKNIEISNNYENDFFLNYKGK